MGCCRGYRIVGVGPSTPLRLVPMNNIGTRSGSLRASPTTGGLEQGPERRPVPTLAGTDSMVLSPSLRAQVAPMDKLLRGGLLWLRGRVRAETGINLALSGLSREPQEIPGPTVSTAFDLCTLAGTLSRNNARVNNPMLKVP